MAMTIAIDIPAGAEVVLPLVMLIALFWAIRKCLVLENVKHSDPACTDFVDSLPPLGERAFTGPELAHRNTQEVIKKEIETLEKNRQAAFAELYTIHARRLKVDKTLASLTETLKRDYPFHHGLREEIQKKIELQNKIRHLTKEREECYGMVDDICHKMYMMLIQRLALRRKIDRLDLQMESARLVDILYPWNIASDGLWDKDTEAKEE
ncbi:hypothetical protein FDENT_960 [Fusarium denticulatum]|uniref:Uncharacterized protein n=1 Tax=Fusarium denticulatum TaxID=48507 RepID=A0A8H5XJX9_9HYPO|nr:hypothetical protein FDENT_960 [Fusarium denticulatum]